MPLKFSPRQSVPTLPVQNSDPLANNSAVLSPDTTLAERWKDRPLCIERKAGEALLASLAPVAVAYQEDDDEDEDDEKDYPCTEDGIACIPVSGPLINGPTWRGTSYQTLEDMCRDAYADPNIKAVLFCYDSPGGEASGMFDLADYMYSVRGSKPTAAIANDACYSAAYCLASSAERLFVTRTGGTGSVGCWMLHADMSGALEQAGVKVTYIFSGDKKVDGNPYEPLSGRAHDDMQEECDRIRAMFVQTVARNRSVSADDLYNTEAGIFMAEKGLPLLADQVGTMDDALAYLRGRMATAAAGAQPGQTETANAVTTVTINGLEYTAITLGPNTAGLFTPIPGADFQIGDVIYAGAIAPHKTSTSDGSWDGPANEGRLRLDQSASYYKRAYAWVDSGKDLTKKNAYRFIHHEVSSSGDIGAANVQACRTGIGVLNGARGGTTIPASDRKGVYAHLSKHLRDAGVEPPEFKSDAQIEAEWQNVPWISADLRGFLPSIESTFLHAAPSASGALVYECGDDDTIFAIRLSGVRASLSAGDSSRLITCCVAPYNQLSGDLGGFRELYQPGCFKEFLESDDQRALFNHNAEKVLGRKSAGTARFYEKADGLYFEAEAPRTQWADDLLVSMRRKDINQGSAAFFMLKPRWEYRNSEKIRIVESARLVEGSIASFPIYGSSHASVEQTSANQHIAQHALLADRLRILKAL